MKRLVKVSAVASIIVFAACGGGSSGGGGGNNGGGNNGGGNNSTQISAEQQQECASTCEMSNEWCTPRGAPESPGCYSQCLDATDNWREGISCIEAAGECMEAFLCRQEYWSDGGCEIPDLIPDDSSVVWDADWSRIGEHIWTLEESAEESFRAETGRFALASDDTPYVVVNIEDRAEVMTFDGGQWTAATDPVPPDTADRAMRILRIIVDGQDRPIVAAEEGTGFSADLRVKRWDGSQWSDLGYPGGSSRIDMVRDDQGNPMVSTTHRIYRYDGSSWSELPDFIGFEGEVDEVKKTVAAVDDGGAVYAYRLAGGEPEQIHVQRLEGGQWELVGDGPVAEYPSDNVNALGINHPFAIDFTPDGAPIVFLNMTIEEGSASTDAAVMWRWDGQAWEQIGDAPCHNMSIVESVLGGAVRSGGHIAGVAVDSLGAPVLAGSQPRRLADDGYFYRWGTSTVGSAQISDHYIAFSSGGTAYKATFKEPWSGSTTVSLERYVP